METKIRRVLPIRQDITYWFCFTGAETEIHKIKDDSKIKREKNIDRQGKRHIVNFWQISDHPSFSLPTTFNGNDVLPLLQFKFALSLFLIMPLPRYVNSYTYSPILLCTGHIFQLLTIIMYYLYKK